ncbi:MAG: TlpA family protein disulfide reductase [Gemmatimonadota bacterium]
MRLRITPRSARLIAGLVIVIAGTAVAQTLRSSDRQVSLLGRPLPDLMLRDVTGKRVRLSERLNGSPAILYVMTAEDCLSCARYPFELRHFTHRGTGRVVLVMSDSDTTYAKNILARYRISSYALLDPERKLSMLIGATANPAALLLDAGRRVLLIDTRSATRYAEYPLSEWFPELFAALSSLENAATSRNGSVAETFNQKEE